MSERWMQLGFQRIDEQHAELFRLVDKTKESLGVGQHDRERAVREALAFLEDYVRFHFLNEEQLMLEYHYDSAQYHAHLKEHKYFIDTFKKLKKEFYESDLKMPDKLLARMTQEVEHWITDHIQKTDHALVFFLYKQGAK